MQLKKLSSIDLRSLMYRIVLNLEKSGEQNFDSVFCSRVFYSNKSWIPRDSCLAGECRGAITANYRRYQDITHCYNDTRCIVSDCSYYSDNPGK